MRWNSLAVLAACAAVTIAGQARAQQPAATPAPVPDQMPFDIPYGNSITADRAGEIVKAVVAEATKSPRNWKLPLVEGGKIIGAVGCSGATGDQDAVACKAGAETVK